MSNAHTKYGPANIDPAEWTWLGNFYRGENLETHQVFKDEHEELEYNLARALDRGEWKDVPRVLSSTVKLNDRHFYKDQDFDLWTGMEQVAFHNNHGCASCGARFQYGSVFVRGDDEFIAVGHECASNLFGLTDLSQVTKRRAAKARKAAKIRDKFEAQIESDQELADAFGLLFDGNPVDHPKDGSVLWGSGAGIVNDIRNKGRRYGSISERQSDLVKKIAREHHERQAEREAEQEELGPVEDVPEGRIEIVGTVISHKWQESYYGDTHKMLVESEDGRWRVWGTVPSKIEDEIYNTQFNDEGYPIASGTLKGSKVRFTAQVERSRDDSTFGFYKRPTKPELIAAGNDE